MVPRSSNAFILGISALSVWGGTLSYAVSVDDHWSLDLSVNPMAAWSKTFSAAYLRKARHIPDLRFQIPD